MAKYFTVTTPETGKDGKTRFHKVGVAFPQSESAKSHITIQLFATPINGELVLFEPRSDDTDDDDAVTE